MTIRTILVCVSTAAVALFAAAACEINNCEEGASCDDWRGSDSRRAECTNYCARLSVCGAAQGRDFDECIDACQDRYERLPEETHRLCACADASSCGDVTEGRCSQPSGSGGTCNSCGSGGSPTGNGGSSNGSGGSPATGGVGSGTGGDSPGPVCQAACDCPASQNCVAGLCVAL
jgi:hypothetical protein